MALISRTDQSNTNLYDYTWCNKRSGKANIRERLDRVIVSSEWRLMFDQAGVLHLSNELSDHSPIQLKIYLDHPPKPRPFRFLEVWTRDSLCEEVMYEACKSADFRDRPASVRFKTHSTALALRKWNKNVFSFCQTRVKELERHLQMLQGKAPTEQNISKERKVQLDLNE